MNRHSFEGSHFPDDVLLCAAEARHPRSDGPDSGDFIEVASRTGSVRHWPFAAQFVQAPALAVAFVAERCREAPGIEVGATRAVLMNHSIVSELRTSEFVERRQFTHRDVLKHHGQK